MKNGPSPKSKQKKIRYILFYFIYALILSRTRKSTAEKDANVEALEQGDVSKPTG